MNRLRNLFLLLGLALVGFSAHAQSPKAGQTVAFPPIPEGYYARGTTCQKAIADGRNGDPPGDLVRFHRKGLQQAMGGPVISRFADLGNGTYRVFARSYGNGDDEVGTPDNFDLTPLGKDAFRIESTSEKRYIEDRYTHCPLSQVPQSIREDWFEF